MAIKPGYKKFTFDGKSSGNYNTYITGSAVYNAPEREVEMIEIPGRNGAFALDKGRFQNIEVTYPAGIYAESQEDFAAALSDLRNMLCSRRGYCRLEDEYNPDEYRMAVYKSGLDVDPAAFQRAGEFEITFDCKPQRWLTSGETAVSVTSGDTISNPTLFEASPLLEVEGYGEIVFNNSTITLYNDLIGSVLLYGAQKQTVTYSSPITFTIPLEKVDTLNANDKIGDGNTLIVKAAFYLPVPYGTVISNWNRVTLAPPWAEGTTSIAGVVCPTATFALEYSKGTAASVNGAIRWSRSIKDDDYIFSEEMTVEITIAYNGSDEIQITFNRPYLGDGYNPQSIALDWNDIYGNSTKSALGNPTYIDADIGEAYMLISDKPVSLNNSVILPAKLPTLAQGSNAITFDNTITDLKVTPRWWRV